MKQPKKIAAVMLEKLVTGGNGLARIDDGRVVFVAGALPGETIRISYADSGKEYLDGKLLEIVEPSSQRIASACQFFGRCGGCDFQHADYAFQVAIKEQILREQFARSGLIPVAAADSLFQPALVSGQAFGYRQRIRLQVDQQTRNIGYFQARSHRVQPVSHCLLAVSQLNETLAILARCTVFPRVCPSIREIELLFSEADGRVVLVLSCGKKLRPSEVAGVRQLLGQCPLVKAIVIEVDGHGLAEVITEAGSLTGSHQPIADVANIVCRIPMAAGDGDLLLRIEPGGFCQVNQEQNRAMIRLLLDLTRDEKKSAMIDFHCGVGNFLLPLAARADMAIGVDLKRAVIRSAEKNSCAAGLANCLFEQGNAADVARRLVHENKKFDRILLDPPRQGCRDLTPYLPELASDLVVYISCDPATLVRDLADLVGKGLRIESVRMIDMFPQTHHIETMVVMRAEKNS